MTTNDLDVFIEHPLLEVTESGTSARTATSAEPSICSVKPSTPADPFVVAAVAAGTTYATVADRAGNSFLVKCTVK